MIIYFFSHHLNFLPVSGHRLVTVSCTIFLLNCVFFMLKKSYRKTLLGKLLLSQAKAKSPKGSYETTSSNLRFKKTNGTRNTVIRSTSPVS